MVAVARPRTRLDPPQNVALLRSDVLDAGSVSDVLSTGADAVASTLGMRYTHPWARRWSPDDFVYRAISNIARAMQEHGIQRLCMISAAGVGNSRPILNRPMRMMLAISNVGVAYSDLDRAEMLLQQTDLDWHAVRPVTLTNKKHRGEARIENSYGPLAMIPRRTVAAFMLAQLEQPRFELRSPVIHR